MTQKHNTDKSTKPETSSTYSTAQQQMDKQSDQPKVSTNELKEQIQKLKKEHQAISEELKAQKKEHQESQLRMLADWKNLQERAEREKVQSRQYAISDFAKSLLDVVDAIDQGLLACTDDHQKEGLALIRKTFLSALEKNHIEVLSPLHETYDPHHHEAMLMQPNTEHPHNEIIQVIQTGFKLKDRLLRPARVVVSQNPTEKPS
ncbi:MAG: nucleotide exchange factor GrpE [Pseudomonadota bacterium]|nr:nucleotide exchange factor GrpE [Pseudomonadota bacterium]